MTQNTSPIIQINELLKLYRTENLVLIDASNGENAKGNFDKLHLDGALFVDLTTQLANITPDSWKYGRHPLPIVEQFTETLSKLGISPHNHVIIYDDKNGANAAARFWWMLKAVGHNKVQVLDGGFQAAVKAGFPINSEIRIPNKTEAYRIEKWSLPLADILEVEKATAANKYLIIDVRDSARFNGEKEPIDLIAGHIPGARNIPFMNNLGEEGLFLPPATLKDMYLEVFGSIKAANIIIHCGSGVTACHTLLAITYAGLEMPKLYVGSWSEWSRNNKTIATSTKH